MFDYYYLILVVPAVILSLIAQIMVQSTFKKYSKIPSSKGVTGKDAANLLLRENGINDVSIEAVKGSLTDHYDPGAKKLRLSETVFAVPSIAAVGVAAHETGHAIQHARAYRPLGLRSGLVPVANIGSTVGPWCAIMGLILNRPVFITIGIFLFSAAVLFYLVTLPVEFNASARAMAILKDQNVLTDDELKGVKKVLTAAAMTYVAAAITALMSLLRLILLSRGGRKR